MITDGGKVFTKEVKATAVILSILLSLIFFSLMYESLEEREATTLCVVKGYQDIIWLDGGYHCLKQENGVITISEGKV